MGLPTGSLCCRCTWKYEPLLSAEGRGVGVRSVAWSRRSVARLSVFPGDSEDAVYDELLKTCDGAFGGRRDVPLS